MKVIVLLIILHCLGGMKLAETQNFHYSCNPRIGVLALIRSSSRDR
jgi:hypothetical protein